jgi:hypothetical protein
MSAWIERTHWVGKKIPCCSDETMRSSSLLRIELPLDEREEPRSSTSLWWKFSLLMGHKATHLVTVNRSLSPAPQLLRLLSYTVCL